MVLPIEKAGPKKKSLKSKIIHTTNLGLVLGLSEINESVKTYLKNP